MAPGHVATIVSTAPPTHRKADGIPRSLRIDRLSKRIARRLHLAVHPEACLKHGICSGAGVTPKDFQSGLSGIFGMDRR